jgi:hypothetical protein
MLCSSVTRFSEYVMKASSTMSVIFKFHASALCKWLPFFKFERSCGLELRS